MSGWPKLLQGQVAVDDRGCVTFANDFAFAHVKRFYMVSNHRSGFVRAWHGHQREEKYVVAVHGSALVCCVQIDNWTSPSPGLPVLRFVLSEMAPSVLHIPSGYANGFMSLTDGAKLIFFSTSLLEDSVKDDFRFPARFWNPWSVEER